MSWHRLNRRKEWPVSASISPRFCTHAVALAILLLHCSISLHAAPQSLLVQTEIASLLSALETSGCQFNRNGTWYQGSEARTHLLEKLRYLQARITIQSTEQFIEVAASASSASGRPYIVKCGTASPVQSKVWLLTKLGAMRTAAPASAPNAK